MDAELEHLRRVIGKQKLGSIPTEVTLRAAYETAYGLYNHNDPDPDRPLALVAAHPKEDYWPYSSMYRYICDFIEMNIYAKTGVDLVTFLRQPVFFTNLVSEAVKIKVEQDSQRDNNAMSQVQKNFSLPPKK